VGLERSLSRAICALETGPMRRTNSSTERSLIARRRLGVPPGNLSSTPVVSPSRALEPRSARTLRKVS
jgi:hypothetical protein